MYYYPGEVYSAFSPCCRGPGVKFKDADLIGIPIQIVSGKTASEGKVEIRDRKTKTPEFLAAEEVAENIRMRIDQCG